MHFTVRERKSVLNENDESRKTKNNSDSSEIAQNNNITMYAFEKS